MIVRRCRCGVTHADRCPDRGEPGHYPDDPIPVAPLLAILLAVLVVGGAVLYGAAKVIGVI